jgi:hypothetical protein
MIDLSPRRHLGDPEATVSTLATFPGFALFVLDVLALANLVRVICQMAA